LAEVKGEKKQRQLAKYLSGVKLARSWNQNWEIGAEINLVNVLQSEKSGGRDRDRTATPACKVNPETPSCSLV
jgi:hypothetical protein